MFDGIFHPARDHDAGAGEWCVRSKRSYFELKVLGKAQAHLIAALLNGEPVSEGIMALIEGWRREEEGKFNSMIRTPWTPEQVEKLNRYQRSDWTHSFTCDGDRSDESHRAYQTEHGGDLGQLVATDAGWICPVCRYRQDWALIQMLNEPYPPPFASMFGNPDADRD